MTRLWILACWCACSRHVADFQSTSANIHAFAASPSQFTPGDMLTFTANFSGHGRLEPLGVTIVSGQALAAAPQVAVAIGSQAVDVALVVTDDAGNTTTQTLTLTAYAAPPTPVISVASAVLANANNLIAETPAQSGFAFSWQVSGNGTLVGAGAGDRVVFGTTEVGELTLTCTATNAVGATRASSRTIAVDGLKSVWARGDKSSDGAATLGKAFALASDGQGGAFVSDTQRHTIEKALSDGSVQRFAGGDNAPGQGDGPRLSATFSAPGPLAFDAQRRLWVVDLTTGLLRRIADDGLVTTLLRDDRFMTATALSVTPSGDALIGNASDLLRVKNGASAVEVLLTSLIGFPALVALSDGVALFAAAPATATSAAYDAELVKRIDLDSLVVSEFSGQAAPTQVLGSYVASGIVDGSASEALLNIQGLSLAADGSVLVADAPNDAIRSIAADGRVSSLAWQQLTPSHPAAPAICHPRLNLDVNATAFAPSAVAYGSLTDTWVINGDAVFLLRTPPP